jgi:hypothetical protein
MLVAIVVMILPSTVHKPATDEILVHGGQLTAAVKNFPVFHVDKIKVYQSPHYPQSLHKMKAFLFKSGCNRLPFKTNRSHVQSKPLSSSLPPNETLYLLKGSEMTFSICTVTNDLAHQDGAYLDFRVEEGLEHISKNQRNPQNHFHHSLSFGYTSDLSNQTQPTSDWDCSSNLNYVVNENGYYSVITIAPRLIEPSDMLLWYNFTFKNKVIDVENNLPGYCPDNSHYLQESEPCNISILSSEHALLSQHQCFVVEVQGKVDPDDISNFTSIVIEYSTWHVGQIAFVATGGSVLCAAALVVVILLCLYCTARRNQQERHNAPSTPTQQINSESPA